MTAPTGPESHAPYADQAARQAREVLQDESNVQPVVCAPPCIYRTRSQ
jgi:hypothetical protein